VEQFGLPIELKFTGDPSLGVIEGYGAVFGNIDSQGDLILPGAFDASLKARLAAGRGLPPMYMMHGRTLGADPRPVGVWTGMQEDGNGLKVAGRLVGLDTEQGRYNLALVRDGAMRGLSVGFQLPPGGYSRGGGKQGEPLRTIRQMVLREVSIVDDPANARAQIASIKSAEGITSAREFEAFLHEQGGFSRTAAKRLAAGGWRTLSKQPDEAKSEAVARFLRRATTEIKGA